MDKPKAGDIVACCGHFIAPEPWSLFVIDGELILTRAGSGDTRVTRYAKLCCECASACRPGEIDDIASKVRGSYIMSAVEADNQPEGEKADGY